MNFTGEAMPAELFEKGDSMAMKRTSTRADVYQRLLLSPVGTMRDPSPPTTLTETILAIYCQLDHATACYGRGREAKGFMFEATRLAYGAMKSFGIVFREEVKKGLLTETCIQKKVTNPAGPFEDKDIREAIDKERDYQDGLKEDRLEGKSRTLSDHLLLMKYYVNETTASWTNCPGDWDALNQIRKLAALGVRAFEEWGIG